MRVWLGIFSPGKFFFLKKSQRYGKAYFRHEAKSFQSIIKKVKRLFFKQLLNLRSYFLWWRSIAPVMFCLLKCHWGILFPLLWTLRKSVCVYATHPLLYLLMIDYTGLIVSKNSSGRSASHEKHVSSTRAHLIPSKFNHIGSNWLLYR